jgi:hypothetical protein
VDSGSHKHPPAGPPDHRTTRERLDSLEQENAALRARLEELEAIVRVLSCNLGWEPGTLGFPPKATP